MKAAVLGATGYTGRSSPSHSRRASRGDGNSRAVVLIAGRGTSVRAVDPGFPREPSKAGSPAESWCLRRGGSWAGKVRRGLFSALPHLKSAEVCAPLFGTTVVIDLSADFRLRDPAVFQAAYGAPLPRPDLLSAAVYGLAEWHTDAIRRRQTSSPIRAATPRPRFSPFSPSRGKGC